MTAKDIVAIEPDKTLVEFAIKRTKWRIDISPYSYILRSLHVPKDKSKEAYWQAESYHKDLFYLLKSLMLKGAMSTKQHDDIIKAITTVLKGLEKSLLSAIAAQGKEI